MVGRPQEHGDAAGLGFRPLGISDKEQRPHCLGEGHGMVGRPQEHGDAAGEEHLAQPPRGGRVTREGGAELAVPHPVEHGLKVLVALGVQLGVRAAHVHLGIGPPLDEAEPVPHELAGVGGRRLVGVAPRARVRLQ